MSYQVNWEIRALDLTAGFLRDDHTGVAALWESVSRLAGEPRPPESFAYGSPDLRRLRAGRALHLRAAPCGKIAIPRIVRPAAPTGRECAMLASTATVFPASPPPA